MTNVRLSYQTIEFGKTDIHVCSLRNNQEYSDPHGEAEKLGICSASWPLFGVLWPSSLVLAHYMSSYHTNAKRILEIGCGIGLASLLLNKQNANITATDYHPEVEKFLERNTSLNNDKPIKFVRTNWSESTSQLGLFDLIIGSDILYEDDHIDLVGNFINQHASKKCEVVIVDPGRGRKNKLSKMMASFGYSTSQDKPIHTDYLEKEFKGFILSYVRTS